jgi:hypothetical protein
MRAALVNFQGRTFDELGLEQARVGEWHNLVVVILDDDLGISNFFRSSYFSTAGFS